MSVVNRVRRGTVFALLSIISVGCGTAKSSKEQTEQKNDTQAVTSTEKPQASAHRAASAVNHHEKELIEDGQTYAVNIWSFDTAHYQIHIVDLGMTKSLTSVFDTTRDELVINGGYFDTHDQPMGLVISNGVVLSAYSKSVSGGVLVVNERGGELLDGDQTPKIEGVKFGIQCKPRLVVNSANNIKKSDGRFAERTALCLRDQGRTIEAIVVHSAKVGAGRGPTLFALAGFLQQYGCEQALNLDGGPSTGAVWLSNGEKKELAPRGAIRHAIVFRRMGRP